MWGIIIGALINNLNTTNIFPHPSLAITLNLFWDLGWVAPPSRYTQFMTSPVTLVLARSALLGLWMMNNTCFLNVMPLIVTEHAFHIPYFTLPQWIWICFWTKTTSAMLPTSYTSCFLNAKTCLTWPDKPSACCRALTGSPPVICNYYYYHTVIYDFTVSVYVPIMCGTQ